MPTYEYVCKQCNNQFEAFQKISAAPLTHCPQCSGVVQRLINGGVGMIFKGSGFYITDYKNGKKSTEKESKPIDKEKKSDPSPDSGGKTEAA